jgi:hypothetical protein
MNYLYRSLCDCRENTWNQGNQYFDPYIKQTVVNDPMHANYPRTLTITDISKSFNFILLYCYLL